MKVDRKSDNTSLVLYGVNDIRLEQTPIPDVIAPDDVLLETDCVGICGSDVHFWSHGRIGPFILKEPMILGHETSAIVREIGEKVTNVMPGQRVAIEPGQACMNCTVCKRGRYNLCADMKFHATPPTHGSLRRFFVHPSHLCFPLPDNVDSESGLCVEPLSVAVHACNRAQVTCGDNVLICGAGPIGLVNFLVAKAYGAASVCITDINENRLKVAKEFGATSTVWIGKDDTPIQVAKKAKESLLIKGFDKTIECSGVQSNVQAGLEATIDGGKIVTVGNQPPEICVSLVNASVREIDIIGSFRYANCYEQAINLLATGKIDVSPFVPHRFTLENTVEAFQTSRSGKSIKAIIKCRANQSNGMK